MRAAARKASEVVWGPRVCPGRGRAASGKVSWKVLENAGSGVRPAWGPVQIRPLSGCVALISGCLYFLLGSVTVKFKGDGA